MQERLQPQGLPTLVTHLARLVDRAFAVATKHQEIAAADTGKASRKDDPHLQMIPIVLG